MQSAGVNALLAIAGGAVTANAGAASAAVTDEGGSAGQQFSQLLSDSGMQYEGQNGAQQFTRGNGLPAGTAIALTAQEVSTDSADALAELLHAREQMITPEDTVALIKRIDKVMEQPRGSVDVQALSQIREQLVAIQRTGEPKSAIEILQSAPAVKDAKLSMVGLMAMLSFKKPVHAPAMPKEEPQQPSALVQSLQAAMFRPDGKDASAATVAAIESEEERPVDADATITLVQPLAAITITPITVNAEVKSPGLTPVRPDLDEAIPSLTLAEDTSLPDIDLPKMNGGALSRHTEVMGSFQALAAAATASSDGMKPGVEAAALANDKGSNGITSIMNPSHTGGLSPTQTVSAAQPVSIIPTLGLINHAPVTEQVHVAIHQAAKDGIERMTIQLDPIDLGRVEINMTMNRDGQTQISFMVDKPETFDHLSRDARMLERSLQEAGIKADTGSMQFNLRQQPQNQQLHSDAGGQGQHGSQQQAENASGAVAAIGGAVALESATKHYLFNVREGVDISA